MLLLVMCSMLMLFARDQQQQQLLGACLPPVLTAQQHPAKSMTPLLLPMCAAACCISITGSLLFVRARVVQPIMDTFVHDATLYMLCVLQYHRTLVLNDNINGGAESILDTVIGELLDNPDRTFVYADLAFFVKWWQELHPETQALVRGLVQQGRFEFANGGITQHDEACSHYSGMIDQMALGMQFLQQEFGVSPKVAWQLDGFGHSNTEALLKSMGGFEALFFGRSDWTDMQQRAAQRNLELLWRGSESYGTETDMLTLQYPAVGYGELQHRLHLGCIVQTCSVVVEALLQV